MKSLSRKRLITAPFREKRFLPEPSISAVKDYSGWKGLFLSRFSFDLSRASDFYHTFYGPRPARIFRFVPNNGTNEWMKNSSNLIFFLYEIRHRITKKKKLFNYVDSTTQEGELFPQSMFSKENRHRI